MNDCCQATVFHQWTKGRDTQFNNLVDLIKQMKIESLCISGAKYSYATHNITYAMDNRHCKYGECWNQIQWK